MAVAFIHSGQQFEMNGTIYELDRQFDKEWQYISVSTKKSHQISKENLEEKYAKGEITFLVRKSEVIPDVIKTKTGELIISYFDCFSEDEQQLMKRRRLFIESILKQYGDTRSQMVLSCACKELWNNQWGKQPSPATAARWMKRYVESDRDIRSLHSGNHRKGNRNSRYPNEVFEICFTAIQNVYLKLTRGSIKKTHEEAIRLIKRENLLRPKENHFEYPKYSYIKALIKGIPEFEKFQKRFGTNLARYKFRNSVHGIICYRLLERVEIDHTQLNHQVIDELHGLVIGRPWLTLITDVFTRAILGFHLSFTPPSQMTVAKALKMALLPKHDIKNRWPSIKNEWVMFGLMQDLVVDNGLEFHGNSLESTCLQLGINISYCPRKQPWWKGHVERALGTLNRAVTDGVPGRTFANIQERAEYDSLANATLTFATTEEIIAKWIVDIYHQTTHSELGQRPQTAWESEAKHQVIPLIANADQLDAIVGIIEKRAHTHKGIELNGFFYNSDELGEIYKQFGYTKNAVIKWDQDDLGHIHYFAPNGLLLRVPVQAKYTNYATGLTHHQHKVYKSYASKYLQDKDDEEALSAAKAALQGLIARDIQTKGKKSRIQRNRLLDKVTNTKSEIHSPKEKEIFEGIYPLETNTPRPRFDSVFSNSKQG